MAVETRDDVVMFETGQLDERAAIVGWLVGPPPPDCVRSKDDQLFREQLARAIKRGEHRWLPHEATRNEGVGDP